MTRYLLLLLLFIAPTATVLSADAVESPDDEALLKQLKDLPTTTFSDQNKGKERAVVEAWFNSLGDRRVHAGVLGTFLFMVQAENWKRRCTQDTKELVDELKQAQEQCADAVLHRTKVENKLKEKDAEIADLRAQLEKATAPKSGP
jgi:hypothetical protein